MVDGLDSVEQRKVLSVLDTVHTLFSDPGSPFIIVLAIDPHVIIKAIELNLNQEFRDTSIGGHAYLRNMVHLPFFLQNAGLRKVKAAQQLAQRYRMAHSWCERDDNTSRRPSIESVRGSKMSSSKKKKLSSCESAANSLTSNLNRVGMGQGPLDMNKMFLTDDYFSDVNPRSMRRLMNVIYVMGRLLKAFNIDFNWHHLASWANITEQWPYRTSWLTLYIDCEEKLEDSLPLSQVIGRIFFIIIGSRFTTECGRQFPLKRRWSHCLKWTGKLLKLINLIIISYWKPVHNFKFRDEKKLEVFLQLHRKNLTVADLKIFLPFTINLDPFIKKVIKDEMQTLEELGHPVMVGRTVSSSQSNHIGPQPPLTRRQAVGLSRKLGDQMHHHQIPPTAGHPPFLPVFPPHSGYPSALSPYLWPPASQPSHTSPLQRPVLPAELQGLNLSCFLLEQVCSLLRATLNSTMVDTYSHTITSNNIDGKVLLHCKLDDLKSVLNMNFGDWETFKLVIEALREDEQNTIAGQRERVDAPGGGSGMRSEGSQERSQLQRSKESKFRPHKVLTSMERQVAMEEATVSGLLSTLNEEAKEDILQEEINIAKEEAEAGGGRGREEQEADYLYYAHAGPAPAVEEGGEGARREEEGLTRNRLRSSGEMIWSASNSRHGSLHDLTNAQVIDQPTFAGTANSSVHTKRRLDMADRAKTVVSLTREEEKRGEADPYAWLSVTAPASPRHSLRELSSQISTDRESDPGSQQSSSMWSRRSLRKTKKAGEGGRRQGEDDSDGETSPSASISRTGSVAKLHKVARKIKSAMGSHDTGQLPAVRRARPNMEVSQSKELATFTIWIFLVLVSF